jgi:hypothetical protein
MEELNFVFHLNWAVTAPKVIQQVVSETLERTEVGGDLWNRCEKPRELILGHFMPILAGDDRKRLHDNNESLAALGDWYLDRGSTLQRKIRTKPSPPVLFQLTKWRSISRVFGTQSNRRRTHIPPHQEGIAVVHTPANGKHIESRSGLR